MKPETVVLIPGLWAPALYLLPLARRLRRAGYAVRRFSYSATRADLRENADRLDRWLRTLDAPAVHLVGHSLGGVLIRALFHYHPRQPPGRIATLAAPHRGSRAAARLARFALGRRLLGRSARQWLAEAPDWPPPARAIGTLSGVRPLGLGRLLAPLAPPNDGVLELAETEWPGAGDRARLAVSHSGMLFSRAAADQIVHFLAHGRFARPA
jgi:pimeloyl-ACP methyl ester carboxylesterase